MTAEQKPTVVIVGGAFHTPANYGKLATALREVGYEVHVPRLLACNEARPPNADLSSDSALVRDYVDSLVQAGRTVIAIAHSYGGQVSSNALYGLGLEARSSKGLQGGVSYIVYMAGYALLKGQSLVDKFLEFGDMEKIGEAFDIAEDNTAVVRDPKGMFGITGPGVSDAETDAYIDALCRWHGNAMSQALEQEAWRDIPVAYIHVTADLTIIPASQENMVENLKKAGRPVKTFTLETGHCPNLTATREVVDIVNTVATN